MILYVVGIAVALGFAALLWRRRQQKGSGWQREVTFFVDLLALSATTLIVGVLAMVQLATPTQTTADTAVVVAPAEPTEVLDGRGSDDFILPEIIDETTPPADAGNEPQPPTQVIPDATETVTTDVTSTPLIITDTTPTAEITPTEDLTPTATVGFITVTPSVGAAVETTATVTTEATATIEPTTEATATRSATATTGTTSGNATPTVRATSTPRPTSTPRATATAEATATTEPPTATPEPTATTGPRIHTVIGGDTLIEIAAQYGVSTADIIAANPNINPNSLRIGDELIIPEAGSAPPAPPPPATQNYTIQAGDTLGAIANRFNTTVAELQRLNPGIDPTRMRVGSTIKVPA